MRIRFVWRAGLGALAVFSMALALTFVGQDAAWAAKGGGGRPGGEAAGNNLSFPVIWSEGVAKALPGTFGVEVLAGGVWYWWGTDPDGNPFACPADPDDTNLCDDGVEGETNGGAPCDGLEEAEINENCTLVYPQQDAANTWQAESVDGTDLPVNVRWIDWGDNLESVDWYTRSQVRTEVVLIQDLATPMVQYDMRHLKGLGIDELWGLAMNSWDLDDPELAAEKLAGPQATVYSHCARLTIQKLLLERGDPALDALVWVPEQGWTGADLINDPFFNKVVHEGGDGPGYYSAEINVKGKVIYGYTWNVRKDNEGPGDYRITFSFDQTCPTVELNTFFVSGTTEILLPVEEELAAEAEPDEEGGGATAVLVPALFDEFGNLVSGNLTYMDVRILERSGGKK